MAILVAGCGSSHAVGSPTTVPPVVTTTTLSVAAAAQAYTAAADMANAALASMDANVNTLASPPQAAALAAAVQPGIVAMMQYQATLNKIGWPANAVTDAHSLAQAVAGFIAVLQTPAQQNGFNASTFETQFMAATAQVTSAVGLLRHDLGLPATAS